MSIRKLSGELQKKAENELNEVPKRIQEDLGHIRHWISKQPHLNVRKDDQWLLNFLRGCKFSLEKTKQKLDMFYTMRTMLPEFFSNRDPFLPEIQEVLELGLVLPLPKTKEPDSPRIVLIRCHDVDPADVPFVTVFKTGTMILDILLNEDDNFVVGGQIALIDLKTMTLSHAVHITPSISKKIMTCVQSAYPLRLKNLLVINTPSFFETVYNVGKPFVKSKILDKIYVVNGENIKKVYKTIPLDFLPVDYGGKDEFVKKLTIEWKRKVENYKDWFLEDSKYCSDETKRLGEPFTSDSMFGIAGSFRYADFD